MDKIETMTKDEIVQAVQDLNLIISTAYKDLPNRGKTQREDGMHFILDSLLMVMSEIF